MQDDGPRRKSTLTGAELGMVLGLAFVQAVVASNSPFGFYLGNDSLVVGGWILASAREPAIPSTGASWRTCLAFRARGCASVFPRSGIGGGQCPTSAEVRPGIFHVDIAEVRTEQGKLYLFVAIDRTSKFASPNCTKKPMGTQPSPS
jgi:hypothetical protein